MLKAPPTHPPIEHTTKQVKFLNFISLHYPPDHSLRQVLSVADRFKKSETLKLGQCQNMWTSAQYHIKNLSEDGLALRGRSFSQCIEYSLLSLCPREISCSLQYDIVIIHSIYLMLINIGMGKRSSFTFLGNCFDEGAQKTLHANAHDYSS